MDATASFDSRVVAMRRLINMTSELESASYKLEALLQSASERASLPRYLLPSVQCAEEAESGDEGEDGEGDEEDDQEEEEDTATLMPEPEDQREGVALKPTQRSHSLLTNGIGAGSNSRVGREEERQSVSPTPPPSDRSADLSNSRMTTRGLSRRSSTT
jgi:hypothetical protein